MPESLTVASHHVDHVIAEKHGGSTDEGKLAVSCSTCNYAKGSDIASIDPESGEIVRLYNPRQDTWSEHVQIESESGMIQTLTAIRRATVSLLQLSRSDRVAERKLWIRAGVFSLSPNRDEQ